MATGITVLGAAGVVWCERATVVVIARLPCPADTIRLDHP